MEDIFRNKRKSYIEIGEVFFWTATINQWQKLLGEDKYKDVIIASLEYLSNAGKIDVFAFVIMPIRYPSDHIHLTWRINELTRWLSGGKETAQGCFLKFTAQEFRKMLLQEGGERFSLYKVDAENKKHEFWQRDSLAIHLYSREVAFQKLKYLHNNPLAEHWQLVKHPCDYKYSSARYYELNEKIFLF